MKTQNELRAFALGTIAGIVILAATVMGMSYAAGIKWQPVQSDWR